MHGGVWKEGVLHCMRGKAFLNIQCEVLSEDLYRKYLFYFLMGKGLRYPNRSGQGTL